MRTGLLRNKKGDATDPMIILIVLAFLSIAFIVGIFVNTKIKQVIDTTPLNQSTAYSSITDSLDNANVNLVQRGFAMILAILVLFTLFSAFLVRQHPAFIFLNIVLLTVTMFVGVFIGNMFGSLQDNAQLGAVIASQPMIALIMTNIVKVILGIGALNMLILFSKFYSAPSGGDDFR